MKHYFTNNTDLKSELRDIKYKYDDSFYVFKSDNGVFSKDKIDFGSDLLLRTYLDNRNLTKLNILDLGCGYGLLGIMLSILRDSSVDLVDVNERAIHLAKENLKSLKASGKSFISNMYENVSDKYDLIITNPPIRAGKEVVYTILGDARKYLKPNGEVWFVIRKEQGAKSTITYLEKFYQLEVMEHKKGFYIISLKTIDKA